MKVQLRESGVELRTTCFLGLWGDPHFRVWVPTHERPDMGKRDSKAAASEPEELSLLPL